MLEYSDITQRTYILLDGEPYEVLESWIKKKQRQKPNNQTKLKNLITGNVIEKVFHQSDKVEEADIDKETITYLYHRPARAGKDAEYWFSWENSPDERFQLDESVIGDTLLFLSENTNVTALLFTDENDEQRVIGLEPPPKVDLEVTEAPPNVKGDTASGSTKRITLSTGATVDAPLFINTGDIVRVNTKTGEYVERVKKA